MKTPSASSFTRPRRVLLAACGSLVFFLLPFILFHPEKKHVVPKPVSKRSIEYLPAGRENADPRLNYILQCQDPRLFLFPGEKRGFALFRVRPEAFQSAAPFEIRFDLLVPPRSSARPPAMKPSPLPRAGTVFQAPLPVSFLHRGSGPESSPSFGAGAVPDKREAFAPEIRTASGRVLPGSRITSFTESEIRSLHPRGPTRLLVESPALPELPGRAEILESCGVPRLDGEACRLLNLLLLARELPDQSPGPDIFSVQWVPPGVSPAFSEKIRADKEEDSES